MEESQEFGSHGRMVCDLVATVLYPITAKVGMGLSG
jgi:hypothetical protein